MRVLEEREVDSFLSRGGVRHIEGNQTVFVQSPHAFGLHYGQVAVYRVLRREKVEAAPKLGQRYCFQPVSARQKERQGDRQRAQHRAPRGNAARDKDSGRDEVQPS